MTDVKSSEKQAVSVLLPDWDTNAARRSLSLAGSGADSVDARGGAASLGSARRVRVKREPSTGKLGQAGTSVWRRSAAA